jgi:hypothetical protein
MYQKQRSQKASPSVRSKPKSKEITPTPTYGSLSAVVQRAQQDPNSISRDEKQQLESAIGGRRDKINLTVQEKENLEKISRNGHASAKKILHARILLMCDQGEQATRKWTDEEIAEALRVHSKVIWRFSTNDARIKLKHLYPVFEEETYPDSIAQF